MLRRRPFNLPYADELPRLTAVLRGVGAPGPIDAKLAAAAMYHNVAGYVLAADGAGARRDGRPGSPRRLLADRHARAVLHSALLRRALPEVVVALAGAGVTPILVKGPAVADRFYPESSLRPFADLDLVVPREALSAGVGALRELGYAPLEEFRPGFAEAFGHDVHLVRRLERARIDVELHWRIGDDPATAALDHLRLAEGSVLLGADTVLRVPGVAEQLLVLAVHLLSDRAKRLAWLQDLALAADAATDEEWERAFDLAAELGLGWVLHRALDYPAALLGHGRPRPAPPGAPPRWGPLRAVETLDVRASPHLGRLALLGWRGRARYVRDVLLPTRAGLEGTVGGDGAPPWRLAARHAARVISAFAPRRT